MRRVNVLIVSLFSYLFCISFTRARLFPCPVPTVATAPLTWVLWLPRANVRCALPESTVPMEQSEATARQDSGVRAETVCRAHRDSTLRPEESALEGAGVLPAPSCPSLAPPTFCATRLEPACPPIASLVPWATAARRAIRSHSLVPLAPGVPTLESQLLA